MAAASILNHINCMSGITTIGLSGVVPLNSLSLKKTKLVDVRFVGAYNLVSATKQGHVYEYYQVG
jgi:hypothetical protein